MRLSAEQKEIIRINAMKYFGENAHIWLFGSRVNDEGRGGDIDLYIEPSKKHAAEIVMAKLQFLREIHKQIGDQKVDVVINRPDQSPDLPIYRIAKQTGVRLQ